MSWLSAIDPASKRRVGCTAIINYRSDEIGIDFKFNEVIKNEIKETLDGARWNPTTKGWTAKNTHRTRFSLANLLGQNPFARYDKELEPYISHRESLFNHQNFIASHILTRKQCIVAGEMGCGKSLSAIEVLEELKLRLGNYEAWYCAPKVALLSVKLEFAKWKAGYYPVFHTYQEMTKRLGGWTPGLKPPRVVFFDESSKLKNPDAKVSQAALHLANAMRDSYGDDCYVVLMSGSPAPKSPCDWWMQAEIACPGFLRESTPRKFLDRVALVKKMVGESGVAWPKVVTFRDDPNKCEVCGKFSEHELHQCDAFHAMTQNAGADADHQLHHFKPMINETEKLYRRLKGLSIVILKKDCLDLPEKTWRTVRMKPTKYMMSMAKMVAKTSGSAANAITQLRELSDGIQYTEKVVGTRPCEKCMVSGASTGMDPEPGIEKPCIFCAGKKKFDIKELDTVRVTTPKTQALIDELELSEDEGRIVIGAAFTGTIEDVVATCVKAGWRYIRRDGTGWSTDLDERDPGRLIQIFQRELPCEYDKIAIIGHPKSISMGLTLHASTKILCYSNSFDGEDRIQFLDRLHRPGCRGCEIVDFVHLPVDQLVLDNLEKKIKLQAVTMGQVLEALESEEGEG